MAIDRVCGYTLQFSPGDASDLLESYLERICLLKENSGAVASHPEYQNLCLSLTDLAEEKKATLSMMNSIRDSSTAAGITVQKVPIENVPSIKDFEVLKAISKGAYGRVCLVRKRTTRDIYALKIMNRKEMHRLRLRENVLAEARPPRPPY